MTTTPKDNTKVSTRKPRISWNDKAITDLNQLLLYFLISGFAGETNGNLARAFVSAALPFLT